MNTATHAVERRRFGRGNTLRVIVLFGGPAGAGKSTLASAWCATRPLAAHVELDEIRGSIVSGLADPQQPSRIQEEQDRVSVDATCALARAFAGGGCDVAIDDVLEPAAFAVHWEPALAGLSWQVVVVLPSLEQTLTRSARRHPQLLVVRAHGRVVT